MGFGTRTFILSSMTSRILFCYEFEQFFFLADSIFVLNRESNAICITQLTDLQNGHVVLFIGYANQLERFFFLRVYYGIY